MKKIFVIFVLFQLFMVSLKAQQVLKQEGSLGGLGGLLDNKIEKVEIRAEDEQSVTVTVFYQNLPSGEDWQIKGVIQNGAKRPMADISTPTEDLSGTKGQIDLTFLLKPSRPYADPYVYSKALKISLIKKKENADELDKLLGDLNLSGSDFNYILNKKWRVGGSEGMVVNIKLTPMGTAKYIQP